jgi:hypothetical protein
MWEVQFMKISQFWEIFNTNNIEYETTFRTV